MVRLSWVCVLVVAVGAACKQKNETPQPAATAAAVTNQIEQLQKEESEFLARREQLAAERRKVNAEKAALVEKRKQVVAAGGDVQAVEQEEAALAERESSLSAQESELQQGYDQLLSRYQEVAATANVTDHVTRREASVAAREKDFSRREADLARREADLASREHALARREKEMCGGQVTTIVQAPPPPAGARYTRRDVEPSLRKARKRMAEKGILSSDLPSPAQALEKEATKAMAEGDYGKAKFAADQLLAMVEAIKIDRAFIAAKIGRLNAAMKSTTLDGDKRTEVDDLFRGATADYGDGKFARANGRLNRIWAAIR